MKIILRNHIELINKKRFLVEERLTKQMLQMCNEERKIWISGQNLSKQ